MKNSISILAFILLWNYSNSQTIKPLSSIYKHVTYDYEVYYKDTNNYFTPFLGDWKYVDGNKTFIATLWKVPKSPSTNSYGVTYYTDDIYGTYKMVQDYGLPSEQTIYTSIKYVPGAAQQRVTVIVADAAYNNELTGKISDVAGPYDPNYYMGVEAFLHMTINAGSSPLTAQWKVSPDEGLGQPNTITIPSNVVLTKM